MDVHQISPDPDTNRLLSIIAWNLSTFFGYDDDRAFETVRTWYPNRDDGFYHHEGPLRSAAFIHYSTNVPENSDFTIWYNENNIARFANDSLDHFRKNYFDG